MYAKTLREQLPRLADQLTAIVQKAKNENNRGLTSDERTAFHSLETDYTALEDSIKIAETSQNIIDELAKEAPGHVITAIQTEQIQDEFRVKGKKDNTPYGKAFGKYMRNGMSALDRDEMKLMQQFQNAQSGATGSTGGFLVPISLAQSLETALKYFGGIEGVTGKIVTEMGNILNLPTENDTTQTGSFIGVNTQVSEQDLTFGQVSFSAYIGTSGLVLVPISLLSDSAFDLDTYIGKALGIRLGRLYNKSCTIGNGTNQPTGIVVASVAAGNTVTFPTGETVTVNYNNLVDLEGAVDPAYRTNGTYMFADSTLKVLKKLVDGNSRPLWVPAINSSFQVGAAVDANAFKPQILDHPYIINQDMAPETAGSNSILFGDLSKYMVREADNGQTSLVVMKERYLDYMQQGFLAWRRWDGNLLDAGTHPVAVSIQSAT